MFASSLALVLPDELGSIQEKYTIAFNVSIYIYIYVLGMCVYVFIYIYIYIYIHTQLLYVMYTICINAC